MLITKEEFLNRDKFAKFCGIELLEISEGYAKAQVKIEPHHFNGAGTVQGGVIFTLADLAFAAAANSFGDLVLAVNVNISYVKAVKEGVITAEAKKIVADIKLPLYEVKVTNQQGEIVALFQGMGYKKRSESPYVISAKY